MSGSSTASYKEERPAEDNLFERHNRVPPMTTKKSRKPKAWAQQQNEKSRPGLKDQEKKKNGF